MDAYTPEMIIRDAVLFINRLCYRLNKFNPGDEVAGKAVDWLTRKGLNSGLLRSPGASPEPAAATDSR